MSSLGHAGVGRGWAHRGLAPLLLVGALAGCQARPSEGRYSCTPGGATGCPEGWVCERRDLAAGFRCFRGFCDRCAPGQHCDGDACVCDGTSCPAGCCDGISCVQPVTVERCGSGGAACLACQPGEECADGLCRCGGTSCAAGQSCTDGACGCGPASCPDGCCDGVRCSTPFTAARCGAGGAACRSCSLPGDYCLGAACQSDHAWADWPMPPDTGQSLAVSADGLTTTDATTGLVWQRDVPGPVAWDAARDACAYLSLDGGGWRLPSTIELLTIVDFGTAGPVADATAFPATPVEWFWASSPFVGFGGFAWGVNFGDGSSSYVGAAGSGRVRCVRGGRAAPPARYETAADTVRDAATGLVWQRALPVETFTWDAAGAYCAALSLDGQTGWRVPGVKELRSLVDERRLAPAMDPDAFPATPFDLHCWSATRVTGHPGASWALYLDTGIAGEVATSLPGRVRCTR